MSDFTKLESLHIVWRNVLVLILLHFAALIGLYQIIVVAKWPSVIFACLCHLIGSMGITAGVHRLWSHRSYKAKLPLRAILVFCQTFAMQNSIIYWVRDHRVHHKWSDTNADPHNIQRGLFYSHVGWLLCRKTQLVKTKGRSIDLTDLWEDPLLRFQHRYYKTLALVIGILLPTTLPVMIWSEMMGAAFCLNMLRYTCTLHSTWVVASFGHRYGHRPFDKRIEPRENALASVIAFGEGWHNYHHTFPNDYKTAEHPYTLNLTTMFIDAFAAIGWVTDRHTVSNQAIERAKQRASGRSEHGGKSMNSVPNGIPVISMPLANPDPVTKRDPES